MTQKEFDEWNNEKKKVNSKILDYNFFYHQREVWWCSVGINVGVETNGKHDNFERPVLIIKKFNKDMFWGVPLTTHEKNGEFFQKIKHEAGVSWALLSQMRISSSKRLLRKIGRISEEDFKMIQNKLRELI